MNGVGYFVGGVLGAYMVAFIGTTFIEATISILIGALLMALLNAKGY